MKMKYLLAASVVSLSTAGLMATPAAAQQITSGVEGKVADETGASISGATVVITDTRTGQKRTISTSSNGLFRAETLITGGPYTITATAPGFEGQTVENQFLNLQGNTDYTFNLTASSDEGVIVVTGTRAGVSQLAVGPGQAFGLEALEGFPSVTRDVRDIIKFNPLVSLERSNEVDEVSCLGGNNRSNSFTVDGISQSDSFGLNNTPFAARNSLPIPFDAIRETSVEFAPFDVEYGQFSGCAINTVTKSGENDFHGTAFVTYTGDSLTGDTVDGQNIAQSPFDRYRWGATLSGPIIKDKLFFFFAYEETDLGNSQDNGPAGAGFANEAAGVNQAQFDEISDVLNTVYGIDTGEIARTLPQTDRRFFGRLDWLINDDHRLEVTYQNLKEGRIEEDDFDQGDSEITGVNSFELEGTESDYYSARLYSQWTDNLSTELRVSRSEVSDLQGPVGGGEAQSDNPINRIVVGIDNSTDLGGGVIAGNGSGEDGAVIAGPGIFRSANQLDRKVDLVKFQANYSAGDHDIKIGTEYNKLDIFNLFAINATGTLFFQNVDDLRAGLLSGGTGFTSAFSSPNDAAGGGIGGAVISASPSGDINEAAADWSRTIWSFYAQDDWRVNDNLSVTVGIRTDIYSGDAPRANPNFLSRYGFTNRNGFSRLAPVLQPRAAFNYDFDNDGFLSNSVLTGGVGIYSGGDPTVWFSNAFSNNGFSTAAASSLDSGCDAVRDANGQIDVTPGGSFSGIPACVIQAASATASAGLADTQSTDPDLKIATVVRANLGFETTLNFSGTDGFFDNWKVNTQYIYSRFRNPYNFVDLSQTPNPSIGLNGFTTDGRPILDAIDPNNAGCNAVLSGSGGTPPIYTGVTTTDSCFSTGRDDEIQFTNAAGYTSHAFGLSLAKRFQGGVITDAGSTNFNLGYAFVDSNNRRNLASSTSTSSFDSTAAFDRQNPAVSTSNFETRHRITAQIDFKEYFFDEFATRLGFSFIAQSGRPYSLTFDNQGVFADSSSGSDNALLYIPTGINDPNLSAASDPVAVQQLVDYANGLGCARDFIGSSIARNTCRNDWSYDLDLRISQEIPGPGRLFGVEDKIQIFADVDNLLNIFDSSANTVRSIGNLVEVAGGGVDAATGQYIISSFNPDDDQNVTTSSSLWRIVLGVRYEF